MEAFFLAMVLYPDAQEKAQAEIDAVVGADRLPEFSDRPSLPYINALVKELLRWHPATPIGVPHRVVADDEYNGCVIPGGATIFANIWCAATSIRESPAGLMYYVGQSCVIRRSIQNLRTSNLNAS